MAITMAAKKKRKRRPVGRPPAENPKKSIASLKATEEFAEWYDDLIAYLRVSGSTAIEHGLILLAKERGFTKPPPER